MAEEWAGQDSPAVLLLHCFDREGFWKTRICRFDGDRLAISAVIQGDGGRIAEQPMGVSVQINYAQWAQCHVHPLARRDHWPTVKFFKISLQSHINDVPQIAHRCTFVKAELRDNEQSGY